MSSIYDPRNAKKSYLTLLKEQGVSASIKSALFVIAMYLFNGFIVHKNTPIVNFVIFYFLFIFYFCWKPKLIGLLTGQLRKRSSNDEFY